MLLAVEGDQAFLGVQRSLTGRRWLMPRIDEQKAQQLSIQHGLPDLLARILAARGVDPGLAGQFLTPRLRDILPDPARFLDMEKATGRIVTAITGGQSIVLFGDYDVDGATGTAVLMNFLRHAGANVSAYIPDRFTEGYGPNTPALLALAGRGAQLVVTIDCGIVAHGPLAAARQAGLDVIVVDHHAAEAELPAAYAVVNPNRLDETPGHGQLAAVGVAFLLCVSINRALRQTGFYNATRPEPDLMSLLDLVALGTVCDVVPLTGLNRALVAQGLKVMARRGNLGLTCLADIARLRESPTAYHTGFLLGPRINAGGRVGKSDLGVRLLTTADSQEAQGIALELDRLNSERQAIEANVLSVAIQQVDETPGMDGFIFASGEEWHPGVIGIVASRLKDRYQRPVCVVGLTGDEGRGSGRSVPGFDLGAAVIAARQAGLLKNGGGHKMAAGFSVARTRITELREFMSERYNKHVAAQPIEAQLRLDGMLQIQALQLDLLEKLEQMGPFGAGHPEPVFALPNVQVEWAAPAGENHVRCRLKGQDGHKIKAIAFRCLDQALGIALMNTRGQTLHVAGRLRVDRWQGRTDLQFFIEDAAFA